MVTVRIVIPPLSPTPHSRHANLLLFLVLNLMRMKPLFLPNILEKWFSTKSSFKPKTPSDDNSSHDSKPLSKKSTNVCCKSCGQLDHMSAVCPNNTPPAQVHAMTKTDDALKASNASRVIMLTQQTDHCPINPNYLLLNSQSTVNLFSNPEHVSNAC